MEEMLDNLKQQILSFPIPLETSVSGHIESHQKTIESFKFFIDIVSKFYSEIQTELSLLKGRNKYLLSNQSELLDLVNNKDAKISKLSTELHNLSNSLNKKQPVKRTFEVNGIAMPFGHIVYFSKSNFTYIINDIKFNRATNHYFSLKKVDGQNVLYLFFSNTGGNDSNIEYSIFITE